MPTLGAPEMIFILVVVLLVFGAGRLPEVGRSLGRAIKRVGVRRAGRRFGGAGEAALPATRAM